MVRSRRSKVTPLVTVVTPLTVVVVSRLSPCSWPHQKVTEVTGGWPPVTLQDRLRDSPSVWPPSWTPLISGGDDGGSVDKKSVFLLWLKQKERISNTHHHKFKREKKVEREKKRKRERRKERKKEKPPTYTTLTGYANSSKERKRFPAIY